VATYAREMLEGKWLLAGDPIRISRTNRLLDGQYRLNAIVKSGTTQTFVVIRGLPDEAQKAMDIGKKRTAADVFSMRGVKSAAAAAAIAGVVMRYDLRNMLDTKYVIQSGELLDFYMADGNRDRVDRAISVAFQVKGAPLPVPPAVSGAIHMIVSRHSEAFAVNDFFTKLIEGTNLQLGDPILAFRNWELRRQAEKLKARRHDHFYLMARAWNAYATNEELFRMQPPRDGLVSSDQIPQLIPVTAMLPEAVTEDNPAVTPYSRTRKEMEARGRATKKRAS